MRERVCVCVVGNDGKGAVGWKVNKLARAHARARSLFLTLQNVYQLELIVFSFFSIVSVFISIVFVEIPMAEQCVPFFPNATLEVTSFSYYFSARYC